MARCARGRPGPWLTPGQRADFKEAGRRHRFDIGESILDELDALIERFGADSPAEDYLRYE